ncbi:MAG TPA: type II secretion system F family protein [Candidatus Limnocylindria bacterium]|jgi:tight adherence protein C|nr:type II secretion system F family protein [Candidatus Limnocylindria bacterium]
MTPQLVITISVTVSVACALLGIYYFWRDGKSPTFVERLSIVANRELRGAPPPSEPKVKGLVDIIVPSFSTGLKPRTGLEQQQLRMKLARAGFSGAHATDLFLGLKMICLILGGCIGAGAGVPIATRQFPLVMWAGLGACLLFYIPDLVLRWLTKKRQEEILLSLPNAVDLLIVAIEVGQGLDAAIRRVTKEIERNSRALSQEFALYSLQLQMGKSRADALHDLGMRAGVADMNSFTTVLIQADRFGVSIAKTMRQLSESARRKRRQRAEERAQKTAVQMIFPLVLFIFPGIFVVLVGPAMIMLWRDLTSMN